MRKSWVTLGLLLAAVLALGVFVWLKPPQTQQASFVLSASKPAEARTLRLARKGKPFATLEKRGDEWMITEPVKAPADPLQVLRLLAVLEAKSGRHYPAADAAKFELDAPPSEITIDNQRFAFGAINNVTREQYVLTQEKIFAVELRFGAAVPADAMALLRKTILTPNETPVRFEFATFKVESDSKKWFTTPSAGDVSQDDFNRWVAQWREGSGLRTEMADARKTASEVVIILKDSRKVALQVVQSTPELIVRRADLGLQFVFTEAVGKQMVSPPTTRR